MPPPLEEDEIVLDTDEQFVSVGEACYERVRESVPEEGEPANTAAEIFTSCKVCLDGEPGEPADESECLTVHTVRYNCVAQTFTNKTASVTCNNGGTSGWNKTTQGNGYCTYTSTTSGGSCEAQGDCVATGAYPGNPDPGDCNCPPPEAESTFCVFTFTRQYNCSTRTFQGGENVSVVQGNASSTAGPQQGQLTAYVHYKRSLC